MNRANRNLYWTVSGIGLAYIAACFAYSLYAQLVAEGAAVYSMYMLLPVPGAEQGLFVSLPGYVDMMNWISVSLHDVIASSSGGFDIDRYWRFLVAAFTVAGFLLVASGPFVKVSKDMCHGEEEPKEKLFTHRGNAAARMLLLPWNGMLAAYRLSFLMLIPVAFFFLFALPFALLMDLVMVLPFLILKAVMGAKIRGASRSDSEEYLENTEYAVCPHCKRNFLRPNVRCRCDQILSYPIPNECGTRYHTCSRGHDMPCTYDDGKRGQLRSVCPFCGRDIMTREARPIVISTVGAPASGKTTLVLSALNNLDEASKECGFSLDPVTPWVSSGRYRQPESAMRTEPGERDSEIVFLKSRRFSREKELLINDISGAEFEPREDKVIFEEYFTYTDGFLFTVDPLSLISPQTSVRRSTPLDTLSSFLSMFNEVTGTGPSYTTTIPVAVVLTKADTPRVSEMLSPSAGTDSDPAARGFLVDNGQEQFVKTLESVFKDVRYYAVASLGRETSSSFHPLKWILSSSDGDLASVMHSGCGENGAD